MNVNNPAAVERELIDRAKTDKEAFLQIYDLYFKRIYDYAYFRTMNRSEAEEITSKTFLAALENIKRYEYRNIPIAVWLYRIASHAVTDLYRQKEKTIDLTDRPVEEQNALTPEDIYVHKSEKERVIKHLKDLPPMQQQAIVLRYTQDLSHKEISQIMDKTEGAVKQLLFRGLTTLRERMMRND